MRQRVRYVASMTPVPKAVKGNFTLAPSWDFLFAKFPLPLRQNFHLDFHAVSLNTSF